MVPDQGCPWQLPEKGYWYLSGRGAAAVCFVKRTTVLNRRDPGTACRPPRASSPSLSPNLPGGGGRGHGHPRVPGGG